MKVHWKIDVPGRAGVAACSWSIAAPLTTRKALVTCKTCRRYIPARRP